MSVVLITGAGSSMAYGFPSGSNLVDLVLQTSSDQNRARSHLHPSFQDPHRKGSIIEMTNRLNQSGSGSIDSFCASGGARDCLPELASLVSHEIMAKEGQASRRLSGDMGRDLSDNWIRFLWNQWSSTRNSIEDWEPNLLRIITFNYDRLIEWMLAQFIMRRHFIDFQKAVEIQERVFPVIHIYGKLGNYYSDDGRDRFGCMDYALEGSEGLFFGRPKKEAKEHENARSWLRSARHVYVLGLSYGKDNCNVLNPKQTKNWIDADLSSNESCLGSSYGLGLAECQNASDALGPLIVSAEDNDTLATNWIKKRARFLLSL